MACRVKIHFIGLSIVPILVVASAELKSAHAQVKLDAYYTATLLGLPIGHISWVIDLKENRFSSVATGSIAGFLRLFLDSRLLAAPGSLSHTGPPFQRPWGLAFWRQQNLHLSLLRIMRAKAIE